MSDSDSFIDEVTEEVRRDRLYGLLRRYGWIGALVILGIVGGTAWTTWRADQAETQAQAFGDDLLSALENNQDDARAAALGIVSTENPMSAMVRDFLLADAQIQSEDIEGARATLAAIENSNDVPMIYRQIASFKGLAASADLLSLDERKSGFESLATAGNPLRVLSEEQLALIEIEQGDTEAAVARLRALLEDAEATPDLQQRALQVIVALGEDPRDAADSDGGN